MSELEHYDREIYELDQRIGRLALACGADLSRHEVVVGLIKGDFESCAHTDALSKLRLAELRALLMLKYKIEASCLDAIGVADCSRLVSEQDARLRRRGFPRESQTDIGEA